MRFEESPEEAFKHRIFIEGDEIEIVGAAYRERASDLAHRDSLEEISDCDCTISEWPEDREELWIDSNKLENVAQVLEGFWKNTAQALREIPYATSEPPFECRMVPKRLRLGKAAAELAELIRMQIEAEGWSEKVETITPDMFASNPLDKSS